VRRVLNDLRHLRSDLSARRGIIEGLVTVGALPLGRTRMLPEAIVGLLTLHPGVRVATNESPFDPLASELRSGDTDFIFGALRPAEYATDLVRETLLTDELTLLARRDHPLFGAKKWDPRRLNAVRWILPRAGSPARELLDKQFAHLHLRAPRPVVETGDLAVIRGLLLRSDMLAAVSERQLERELAAGELRRIPLSMNRTSREIGLTYRANCVHSPAALALMEQLRNAARREGQSG